MKGKSSRPNSGPTVASEVVEADSISCVPPRSADCCCNSLPSCDEANSRTFILPPLLASRISANFCTPKLTGWSVLLRWPQRIVRSCPSWAEAEPTNRPAAAPSSQQNGTQPHQILPEPNGCQAAACCRLCCAWPSAAENHTM